LALIVCALGVAVIYLVVYRISKRFGMTNSTTVLVDTAWQSIRERRFKVPVGQLMLSGARNVFYGWTALLILAGGIAIVLLAAFVFKQLGLP
jgi:hypothetical protein